MKRVISAILLMVMICCLGCASAEQTATGLEKFSVRNGSRESRKIAITMDDVNEREWVWKAVELCREYGVTMTFFPNGYNMHEEDREGWLDVIDAGCEIASHGQTHQNMKNFTAWNVVWTLMMFQENLDAALGFHYPVRWYRPPFGNIADADGNTREHTTAIRKCGYDHVILWDVSETDPEKALRKVQNGSILLFHARKRDYLCIEAMLPKLLEEGYEPVTVSELFGMELPEAGGDPYIYDKNQFRQKSN